MKELTLEKIHKSQLDTLLIFRDFCQKYNLKYYLAFGTLLGAVRHKGFIPWDDDIDVVMPKKDYDFLIENFNKNSTTDRELISKKTNKNFYLNFAKIIDQNTVVKEKGKKLKIGMWIDIFPLEFIIDDEKLYKHINKKIAITNIFINLLNKKYDSERAWYKNIFIIFSKIFFPLYKLLYCINKKQIEKIKSKRETKNYGLFFRNYGKYGVPYIPKDCFEPNVKLQFEGELFDVPKEFKNILKWFYGDYMKLPPKEEQVSHHKYLCYWKEEK